MFARLLELVIGLILIIAFIKVAKSQLKGDSVEKESKKNE